MGQQEVSGSEGDAQLRRFLRALLDDVQALERMLEEGWIESGIRRIGAEQEMFLIGRSCEPAPVAERVLEHLQDPQFTTELALFNLEVNLSPTTLGGDCLRRMEQEIHEKLAKAREAAAQEDARILLAGILPTVELRHLGLEAMTPKPRYYALNRAMSDMRGGRFETHIKGLDELHAEHDNVMLEACNTSFQVHFQVGPAEFASLYNLAQVVTAPVLAAAVNSPVLLKSRLWHETRVALFQQSVDARSKVHQARGQRTRVSFGENWVKKSVLEIFREDIARFRVVLASELEGSSLEYLARGEAPPLTALRLHNGTVYRWNRPCYGVHEGKAHLRIENRVLPAGPTVLDELANAAFFFGLMCAVGEEYPDVTRHINFDEVRDNFLGSARYGLKTRIQWLDGRAYDAATLILDTLLPMARQGLLSRGVSGADVDRYLGVMEERVASGQTGSQWVLNTLGRMGQTGTRDARYRTLTSGMLSRQLGGEPVHTWDPVCLSEGRQDWRDSFQTVGQVMKTDLFTVRPGDPVDLTASLMDWEHIRHVPVEDDAGRLVGLVSHRALVRLLCHGPGQESRSSVVVRDIMRENPVTVSPSDPILSAMDAMQRHGVSCLPVVEGDRLVGIVTEVDFLEAARTALTILLEERT